MGVVCAGMKHSLAGGSKDNFSNKLLRICRLERFVKDKFKCLLKTWYIIGLKTVFLKYLLVIARIFKFWIILLAFDRFIVENLKR